MNSSKTSRQDNTDSKNTSIETYKRHILRARDAGNWFQFSRHYAKAFGKMEALFIQDLINHASKPKTRFDSEGFFRCSRKRLEQSLDWEKNLQTKIINWLIAQKFIEVKFIGIPRTRWIKIDIVAIEAALDRFLDKKSSKLTRRGDQSQKGKTHQKQRPSKQISEQLSNTSASADHQSPQLDPCKTREKTNGVHPINTSASADNWTSASADNYLYKEDTGVSSPTGNIKDRKPLRGADRSVASLPPAACFGGVSSHIQGIENAKQESVASLPPPANKVTSNNDITKDETKNAIEDLMPQGSEQKLTKASSAERKLATQLYEGLQSQRHIKVRPDLNKWTLIFKKLIPLVMGGVTEIEKVIKLHVQSLSDPYHIRAYCAESFCRRYNDLANKLLNVEVKAEESAEQPKNAKERYLCEEITQLDWRHGSIDVIQTAALRSYRFLCDFVNQLEEFNKTPKAQRFKWLLDELIYNYAHLPEPVIHYYTRFCRSTNKYRSYKSAVPVLSINHKDLPTALADLIEEFDLSLWNRMMEAFKGD